MSRTLSSAAWVVHDVGLAATIGGTLFGRTALEPALERIEKPMERDLVSSTAWQRFSWLNLGAHVMFASTWFVGRKLLTGREAGHTARGLTKLKDGLVIASLVSGVASIVLGRRLGKRARHGMGPEQVREHGADTRERERTERTERAVGSLGIINMISNIAVLGVTAVLAMQSSKSVRFATSTRRLP